MNFFFGLKNNFFESNLQIPKFTNRKQKYKSNINLFKIKIENKFWNIEKLDNIKNDQNFFYVDTDLSNNDNIFFLANDTEILNFNKDKILNYSNFTETYPAFRCNLEIFNLKSGFSSFQSEYPFSLINKRGMTLSPIATLLNNNAEKNFIFFKNIIEKPLKQIFFGYLINVKTKKIEKKIELFSNYSNIFEVNKEFINPEIYFVTDNHLGVPMYISVNENHISFEHTHPPHEYIQSDNRFKKISEIKNEINEIIS
tara:strand:+ start:834 stop:1598 length:765 start_codon:yes stop_codon:yes gene_type:complete